MDGNLADSKRNVLLSSRRRRIFLAYSTLSFHLITHRFFQGFASAFGASAINITFYNFFLSSY